jgi:hypothetical protein
VVEAGAVRGRGETGLTSEEAMKELLALAFGLVVLPSVATGSGFGSSHASEAEWAPHRWAQSSGAPSMGAGCVCIAGTPENEPSCGLPEDTTNGGCNYEPVSTSPIVLNETVCGTVSHDRPNVDRDTDWYEVQITQPGTYTWSVAAEFSAQIHVMDTECSPTTILQTDFSTGCGDTAIASMELVPGTYRFFVAPSFSGPSLPCGSQYAARLTGPPASSWSLATPLATDTYGAAAASDDRYVYVGGGFSSDANSYSTQFWRWDPVTDDWTPRADLPVGVELPSLVYGRNGKIYLFGGFAKSAASAETFVYDIELNSWSKGPEMPAPRHQMSSGYHSNWIYLAGGFPDGSVGAPNPALWAFHVSTGTWNSTLDPVPAAFGGAAGAVVGGQFLVAGGRDSIDPERDTLFVYDIASGSWSAGPDLLFGINVPGSAATEDGELWLYGGGNASTWRPGDVPTRASTASTGCQRYSFLSGWSSCPDLNVARSSAAGAEIGGMLIAVGGFNGSTSIETLETFTVSAIFLDGFESGYEDEWSRLVVSTDLSEKSASGPVKSPATPR